MRHFVAYHNADRMGYSVEDSNPRGLYTSKRTAAVGDVIWIVAGKGKMPKQYKLSSWFVVSEIATADRAEFGFRLTGVEGGPLEPAPVLNDLPWFSDVFKQTAHFSLGLQEMKDAGVISSLKQLAAAANRPVT